MHERTTKSRGRMGTLKEEEKMECGYWRIRIKSGYIKKFWKVQKEGFTKGSGKGWKNGFI